MNAQMARKYDARSAHTTTAETYSNLSDSVMFVGDFISMLETFCCAKKNPSGRVLKHIHSHLKLTYLNND